MSPWAYRPPASRRTHSRLNCIKMGHFLSEAIVRCQKRVGFGVPRFVLSSVAMAALALPTSASNADSSGAPIRVVTLGTSLTARGGWQQDLAFAVAECTGRAVEVHRVALPGANSKWGLAVIDSVTAHAPDVVVIEFAINDAELWGGVSLEESRQNLREMTSILRQGDDGVRIVLPSMSPAHGLRGWVRPFLGSYYQDLATLAAELDATYVDINARWQAMPQDDLAAALPDGIHPVPAIATAIIVPELAGAVAGKDCDAAGPPP
jgi:acyl-CoA thioesterase I